MNQRPSSESYRVKLVKKKKGGKKKIIKKKNKKPSPFYEIQRRITMFTGSATVPCRQPDECSPYLPSWSIWSMTSHPSKWYFSSGFPTKILYAFLFHCMCYVPRHIKSYVGLLPLIFASSTNHKAPDYTVLANLLLCLFDSKYLPQHLVLKHRQSVSFPSLNVRPYVTIVQNSRQD